MKKKMLMVLRGVFVSALALCLVFSSVLSTVVCASETSAEDETPTSVFSPDTHWLLLCNSEVYKGEETITFLNWVFNGVGVVTEGLLEMAREKVLEYLEDSGSIKIYEDNVYVYDTITGTQLNDIREIIKEEIAAVDAPLYTYYPFKGSALGYTDPTSTTGFNHDKYGMKFSALHPNSTEDNPMWVNGWKQQQFFYNAFNSFDYIIGVDNATTSTINMKVIYPDKYKYAYLSNGNIRFVDESLLPAFDACVYRYNGTFCFYTPLSLVIDETSSFYALDEADIKFIDNAFTWADVTNVEAMEATIKISDGLYCADGTQTASGGIVKLVSVGTEGLTAINMNCVGGMYVFDSLSSLRSYVEDLPGIFYTSNWYQPTYNDITLNQDTISNYTNENITNIYNNIINNATPGMTPEELTVVVDESINEYLNGIENNTGEISAGVQETNSLLKKILDSIKDFFKDCLKYLKEIRDYNKKMNDSLAALVGIETVEVIDDIFGEEEGDTTPMSLASAFTVADEMKQKFPFSLPWDVYYIFLSFAKTPEAPRFELVLSLEKYGINEKIEIDFAQFQVLSDVSRGFLSATFAIYLVHLTKKVL